MTPTWDYTRNERGKNGTSPLFFPVPNTPTSACALKSKPLLSITQWALPFSNSLEQYHHLNSTRGGSLGLKNLSVVSVSDVNFKAQLAIWPLNSNSEMSSYGSKVRINGSSFDYQETENGKGILHKSYLVSSLSRFKNLV